MASEIVEFVVDSADVIEARPAGSSLHRRRP